LLHRAEQNEWHILGYEPMKRVVLKNASANLFRLAISGVVALALPPFLVRTLSTTTYGTWMLLLQLAGYSAFLEFGLQVAVARFVAHAEELNDREQRDGIVSTAFLILVFVAGLGLCLIGVLAWLLPRMFPAMPVGLHRESQTALLAMGTAFAVSLPFSAIQAVFIGQQRNEVPVVIVIGAKLTMAVLVVASVFAHLGIAAMGAGVAISNLFSAGASYVAWRTWASEVRIRVHLVTRSYAKLIITYCAGLGVWYLSMILISGLDLIVVARFDYAATAYYATAVVLTNVVVLAQNAIFAALLPASAVLSAREDSHRLGTLLVSSTRYGMLILLFMALPLILGGKMILGVWIGQEFAARSTLIMQTLVAANLVRLSFLPYATLLLGAGLQGKVLFSPIAESITNLLCSVVGAVLWGAEGVALGTLVGSFVGITVHFTYHMPRTTAIAVDRSLFVKDGLLRPLICALPFFGLILIHAMSPNMPPGTLVLLFCIAAVGATCLLWSVGLRFSDRQFLERVLST
jgi:O-antigen/teichoic acid export membrane protein